MLKLPLPGHLQRSAGKIAGLAMLVAVAGSVYAASTPPATQPVVGVDEYQLDMTIELNTDDAHARHAERMIVALCLAPGKNGAVKTHGWKIDATPVPEGAKRLRIDVAVADADGAPVARSRLHGVLGETSHDEGKVADGKHGYAIDVTPQAGCPARTATADTGARLRLVSQGARNEPARSIAVSVAAKAGLTLINPELLDNRLVTLDFDQIPAERAMQLVADIDGMKAVFEGSRVHFEMK